MDLQVEDEEVCGESCVEVERVYNGASKETSIK
jgi:hypothetical protein